MADSEALKTADKFFELPSLPNGKVLLVKAAGTSSKKAKPTTQAARLGVRVKKVFISRQWVRDYNAVCGFAEDHISLTAPQVIAGPLHMYLMSRKEHPFAMLGMVHLHNDIELIKPLEFETAYDVVVSIGDTRAIPQGLEFDVLTEYMKDGEVVWRATMAILSRVKGMPKPAGKPAPLEALSAANAQYVPIKVPEDQGRKYAKVSNDYNPIHLYARTAKLFGFKQAIAHGMWTAAKSLSLIESSMDKPASRFKVSFKQPVFLPSRGTLKFVGDKAGTKFELLAERDSKLLIVGEVA
ncbi:MaoC/PaaZ C-terminal domain-containing protein [Limnobacter litoralis]|uniref:MaoC-like domain-containing protein n=1 Tax=Limnobacter litoralis TaxID=481366 RepID=A0ABQ5YPA7_9BURK|nr:MaoC/PaaZ C-terminal domain-containing protein [Limnobacter litoralis]GLR25949.1 hypothetical protein GCM10007875_10370 [Limnobacter litoralis]